MITHRPLKNGPVGHVRIMLTAFTTVAGILAGFITGQALGRAQKD